MSHEFHSDGKDVMTISTVFLSKNVSHLAFGIAVLIILITLGVSLWGLHQTVGVFESVIHAEKVSDELLRVFADLKKAENQQREYLLTGNSQFLDPYHQAVEHIQTGLTALENLAMTPTRRDQVFPGFKNLVLDRLNLLQHILDVRNTQGTQAALEEIQSGEGSSSQQKSDKKSWIFTQKTWRILFPSMTPHIPWRNSRSSL